MPNIKNIKLVNNGVTTTYDIQDTVTGRVTFNATPTLASSATTTKVATFSIRDRINNVWGSLRTVDFYSTSGSMSGNDYEAEVIGTNLIFSTHQSTPTSIGTMIDASSYSQVYPVLNALESAITGASHSAGKNTIRYTFPITVNLTYYTQQVLGTYTANNITHYAGIQGPTISTVTNYGINASYSIQTPSSGSAIYSTTTVSVAQANPGGGGNQEAM